MVFATTFGVHQITDADTIKKNMRTIGLLSEIISRSYSRKSFSSTSSGLRSYNSATHIAAVFRTYGFSSCRHFCNVPAR